MTNMYRRLNIEGLLNEICNVINKMYKYYKHESFYNINRNEKINILLQLLFLANYKDKDLKVVFVNPDYIIDTNRMDLYKDKFKSFNITLLFNEEKILENDISDSLIFRDDCEFKPSVEINSNNTFININDSNSLLTIMDVISDLLEYCRYIKINNISMSKEDEELLSNFKNKYNF